MNTTTKQVLDDALRLPDADRAELADRLLESLSLPNNGDIATAWDAEIHNRIEDIESGRVKTIPWSEARAMIMRSDDAEASD